MKDRQAAMKRLAALAAACVLSAGGLISWSVPAHAQMAAGKGPIDVTADNLEMVDSQHLAIWKGNVEAVQNGNRLVSDILNVYFTGHPAPGAPAKAAPAPGGAQALGSDWGAVQRLVADGHVFYVSPDQTARGDHAVYEMTPDTITMTGNVVVVQGQNVIKGDKLIIDVKTNHANIVSNVQGRNRPERVRGVFYNDNASPGAAASPAGGGGKPAAAAGPSSAKPAAAKP
jgi:lipopolysaccharide export system protein LptA